MILKVMTVKVMSPQNCCLIKTCARKTTLWIL